MPRPNADVVRDSNTRRGCVNGGMTPTAASLNLQSPNRRVTRLHRRRGDTASLLSLVILCTVAAGRPPDEIAAAEREFLESLALARARTKLIGRMEVLPLVDDLTVGRWASQNIGRERKLRLWGRSLPRVGPVRIYSDASCDVDVCLSPTALAAAILEISAADGRTAAGVSADEVRTAVASWPELWVSGSSELVEMTSLRAPAGWEDVSAEGIVLAEQAAVADAVHALLEKAGGLRVTAARRLKIFLDSEDIYEPVFQAVKSAAKVVVEATTEQVAVARIDIGMTEFIRILTEVHQAHYRGSDFHAPDFRDMTLSNNEPRLEAIGVAVPPERYRLRERTSPRAADQPAWVEQMLSTTGRCLRSPSDRIAYEERIESARIEAFASLRRQAEELVVSGNVTVGLFLESHPELRDDFALFLSGARVHVVRSDESASTAPDGAVFVQADLPLLRLWKIVTRGVKPSEAELPKKDRPAEGEAKG